MPSTSESGLLLSLIFLVLVFVLGRGLGDLAARYGQPEILGQLLAGFVLGPSIFGLIAPGPFHAIYHSGVVVDALSIMSWIGAILLLLRAGTDVDLDVIRRQITPSALAAAGAIIPSLLLGIAFGRYVIGTNGFMLGIVLSVTGTTVVSAVLTSLGVTDRRFTQVMLAAGIISEMVVWLLVSVASSAYAPSPLATFGIAALFALAFLVAAYFLARPAIDFSMRVVTDLMGLAEVRLSLVMAYTFLFALITQALGLHVLLGAFVFGLLLSQAPRFDTRLKDQISVATTSFFSPIFFVVAGTRVDVTQLHGISAVGTILLLFATATTVKIGFAWLGARLGGVRGWQAVLIGVGLNLKAGTDVIAAAVGVQLKLLSSVGFTMYTVVALLTVLLSPPVIGWLVHRSPPSETEEERLRTQRSERRAYVTHLQRVLIPLDARLRPILAAGVAAIATRGRTRSDEPVDIIEIVPHNHSEPSGARKTVKTILSDLEERAGLIHVFERIAPTDDLVHATKAIVRPNDIISIGARPPSADEGFTLGPLQNRFVERAPADLLITVAAPDDLACDQINRILIPVNGLEFSLAAATIGGLLGAGCRAQVVVMTVVADDTTQLEVNRRRLEAAGQSVVNEAAFVLESFDVSVEKCVILGTDVVGEILRELKRGSYDLLVLSGINRGKDEVYLGRTIEAVLTRVDIPACLFLGRGAPPAE